ncbi:hypothetical protein SAMN05216439_1281 [Methanobrevibacter gottschalkii]|uniref:Uncharacterized protein n=1 Tax=Methanobrevibacter gottschalkii TaxID=190974 RepID=A0A1H7IY83_9EURY|nr:hypothetical protein [Methanobrevibacter gottschalkii]SEK66630.1 hypothetical protein SAMN05216439_1281 [Methanobrevibacter gottschalkii]
MKKYISISIIVIIIIAFGLLIFGGNTQIGSESMSKIIIPNGFNIYKTTNDTLIISNKSSNYTITEIGNKTIKSVFDEYNLKHENHTVSMSSTTVGDTKLFGLNLKINETFIHTNYFYEKNGITYQIYPDGDYDFDTIKQLVSSTNKKFII